MNRLKKLWPNFSGSETMVVFGLLILAAGYIFMNPPQCPANYTLEQIDSSGCSVGANIGLGLIVIISFLAIVGGLIGIAFHTKKRWLKYLLLIVVILSVGGVIATWKQQEDNSNRIYCTEKIKNKEPIFEGNAFCDKYR